MELCTSAWFPSSWRSASWFLSKARCLSSASEWILDLFSSFIAELTILLHLLGLYASQSSWNFCAVRNWSLRLNLFRQAYLAHSTIPEENEDLLIHENVTRFLNECFLRTVKHEKSVMRTNIQDCRTISGTFLYPNPDCYFRNQFCVRLCNNPQMKFESKEDSLRRDSWIKSKCGLLRFWFVRFFGHGRILEVYLRSGFNVRK